MRLDADPIFAPLDLEGRRTILVAISGGSDSTALLLLFNSFAEKHGLRIVAATVDHQLRTGSTNEARHVASLCETLAIEHRTLVWTGAKPATGIPAAARLARYSLLAEAARDLAADIVLLGHTADDQAETVAMRTARGTTDGPDRRGDAGMAPAVLFDDAVWFVRPLLTSRRSELRAFLQSSGTAWIDDPTNLDPAYERARLRASGEMPDIGPDGVTGRLAANEAAARQIATHVTFPAAGLFRVDRQLFAEDGLLAMRMLLAVAGGTEHLTDASRSRALFEKIGFPLRATLSRAVVDARRDAVWLYRENRDLPSLPPGTCDWDRRWRLPHPLDAGLTISPIGAAAEPLIVPEGATQALVRHALAAEPGLWRGLEFVTPLDAANDIGAHRILGPWHRFLPSFDLASAAALRTLVGLPKLPAAPWRDHNRSEA